MSTLIEYEEITSRRMLMDLIDQHGHVVITQNEQVIFEANRRQNPDSIFATLELVSDPDLRKAILARTRRRRQGTSIFFGRSGTND